jgi:DNA-binding MarR family transcriptional regulator
MTFDKRQSAGYLTNHLARLFAQALHERIRPLGLAPAQFMTLLELWAEDGLTQRELVLRLDVEQATMANTLARMARDGLVVRRPHPEDGRAQQVWLTAKARALEGPATAAARSVNQTALDGLSDEERRQFLALLDRAIEELREGRGDAG